MGEEREEEQASANVTNSRDGSELQRSRCEPSQSLGVLEI